MSYFTSSQDMVVRAIFKRILKAEADGGYICDGTIIEMAKGIRECNLLEAVEKNATVELIREDVDVVHNIMLECSEISSSLPLTPIELDRVLDLVLESDHSDHDEFISDTINNVIDEREDDE